MPDVYAFSFANLHGVKTRRLAANRVDTGGRDFNIFAISGQSTKQALGDGAATDIAGANKEDAFHGSVRAANAQSR